MRAGASNAGQRRRRAALAAPRGSHIPQPNRHVMLRLLRAALLGVLAAAGSPAAARPRLTVVIVSEQFRPDYFEQFRASFSAGGFRRLLEGGSVFRNCRYEYAATFPASGAAVLSTGAYPELSGIPAEHWYDRQKHQVVSAVEDASYFTVGSGQPRRPGASPRKLLAGTIADQLRLATAGRSRAVSISLRDQTAVLFGGAKPAGCYWMDEGGRFVTSSYYSDTLPQWAEAFNKTHPALRFRGQPWTAAGAPPSAPPLRVLAPVDPINLQEFFAAFLASPFAVDEEFDFAQEAIAAEKLGEGPSGDLLVLSVSSPFLLGLETGAQSPLVRDLVVRLDRRMEEFFTWLDSRYGVGQVCIAFTATQGLPDSPESLDAGGLHAERVSGEQVAAAVNSRLTALYGRAPRGLSSYVEKYVFPWLYLRQEVTELYPDAARLAGEAAMSVPGVAGYLVPNGRSSFLTRETRQLLARCWSAGRAGDVLIAYQPYHFESFGNGRGVAPGSLYNYDTVVPLLLYGPALHADIFDAVVNPADFAPTLAAALDIPPPSSANGQVLAEALKER